MRVYVGLTGKFVTLPPIRHTSRYLLIRGRYSQFKLLDVSIT